MSNPATLKPPYKPGESGNPEGSKPVEIDLEQLESIAATHATQREIAAHFGLTTRTIEKRMADAETKYTVKAAGVHPETGEPNTDQLTFREIVDRGRARSLISLRSAQFKLAQGGNATMQIWLGKQYLDQRDQLDMQHTGKDGEALFDVAAIRAAFKKPS